MDWPVTFQSSSVKFFLLLTALTVPDLVIQADSVNGSTRVKLGIVMTSNTVLPFDYYNMAPAISLAMERSLNEYNIQFEPYLGLYEGTCSQELAALGQTVRVLNESVDVILGPACTDDLVVTAKLTTVYQVALLTGSGSVVESMEQWPYVRRMAYNTYSQWAIFGRMTRDYNWTNLFVMYESDSVYYAGVAQSKKPNGQVSV